MIEALRARNGDLALRLDGKLLCSAIDPSKEASAWVANQASVLAHYRFGFVLGLGAGHHLRMLKQKHPMFTFVVIETNAEVIEHIYQLPMTDKHGELLRTLPLVGFHTPHFDTKKIWDVSLVKQIACRPFCILRHPASIQGAPEKYGLIAKELLGRNSESFLQHIKLRSELALEFDELKIKFDYEEIHIHKLTSWLSKPTEDVSEARRIFQVLEELVK